MPNERWQKIVEIFENALDLPEDARSKFLDDVIPDDPGIRLEVEAMLSADADAQDFIESPILSASSFSILNEIRNEIEPENSRDGENLIGKRVGAFRLARELGRGGMGAVYLAERADGEFEQFVAIKLIKRGMDSDFIIKRFRHERQILANLEHQNIARLFDGGTTDEGLPYLVMEYIEGESLYRFCDAEKMDLNRRLAFFQQICAAVDFAHQNQVIHRDIKPNNILVTKQGIPKLLDFGIAKILDPDLIHESVSPTASMMRLLTPDYASPEQIRGEEVTHATDIYSLGVMLFELLTGHRPFNFSRLSLHEISRIVCEDAPEIPSDVITKPENLLSLYSPKNDGSLDFAEVRGANASQLKSALAKNLDNIILKALAKNPGERYTTAAELSEDISKHLRGEEIAAEIPHSRAAVKFRSEPNDFSVPGSKSLAVLPFKQLNLLKEEDTGEKFLGLGLADAITTRLSKIRRFVVRPTSSIMRFADEIADPITIGNELGVEFILDGHIKRANKRLRITVQLLDIKRNATVWATSIDENFGDIFTLEDAISTKVTEALLPHLSENELEQFARRGTNSSDAYEHYLRGRYHISFFNEAGFAKSIVCFHKAIAEDPNYAPAYSGIADYYNWLGIFGVLPPSECSPAAIEAAATAVKLDPELAEAHTSYGFSLHAGNCDWAKAEQHFFRSLELNPNYVTNYTWLAILRFTEGRFNEGIRFAKRSIELDPFYAFNHHNLGWGLYFARRFDESVKQYQHLIENFPRSGLGYYAISKVLRFLGRHDEALSASEKAMELFENGVFSLLGHTESLAAAGKTLEAREYIEKLEAMSNERYVSPYQMALVYSYLKDKDNAFRSLEKAFIAEDVWLNWLNVEPAFDVLRDDSRFSTAIEKIAAKINFPRSMIDESSAGGFFVEYDRESALILTPDRDLQNDHSFQNRETLMMKDGELNEVIAKSEPVSNLRLSKPKLLKFAFPVFGLLVIAALYFTNIFSLTFDSKPSALPPATAKSLTLVVLPFVAENSEAEQNLGVGIAESLSNKLGNLKRLTVISASSGRALSDKSIAEIGEQLAVGYVLRGRIKMVNDEPQISAEFVGTGDGKPVWNEDFSSATGDLIGSQTKIAEKIWTTLQIEPSPVELELVSKRYTENQNAFELYLLGRYQMTTRSPENLRNAISTFAQSLDADPKFALAYVGLADAYALLNLYQIPPPEDAYAKAKENALKALTIDESLAEAHASLAYVKFYADRDRVGAELEFRRAIQINPSYSTAHHWFALVSAAMKDPSGSISEAKIAQSLDPQSPSISAATAITYFYNRQYNEALAEAEKALKINSGFVPAHKVKRWIYQAMGNYDAAMNSFLRERSLSGGSDVPGWYVTQAQLDASGSEREKSLEKLNRAVADSSIQNNPSSYAYEIALSYAAFGEIRKSLDWLERAEAEGSYSVNFLEVDPRLDAIRREPRYAELVKKLTTVKTSK